MTALPIVGQTVTTARVNVRQGAASTSAPVLRTLEPGTAVPVVALVVGTAVQGNAHWFQTGQNGYVWSGGCGPFTPAPAPSPAVPVVVDLYHGDAVASFAQAKAAGLRGVIHKATTGQSGTDPAYAQRRSAARAAGLLWGAYHWGTAAPADKQVENFLATAQPDNDTLVALDFEPDKGNQMTLDGARQFLQGVRDKLGRRAVLYSGSLIKSQLGTTKDAFFGAHRLWLAQYGSQPSVQASWSTYWLWQYTDGTDGPDPKACPGIPGDSAGKLDCDHYQGGEDQLAAEWAS
ncbi:MAG: glycoside hydrolase family 25 protein [Rhizomicrobium sp.]